MFYFVYKMALKCVCLFVLLGQLILASRMPPRILEGNEDRIINVGEDHNLTCQGSESVQWFKPPVTDIAKQNWTSFSEVPHNDDGVYSSVLQITNMSYPFVGYYTCKYGSRNNNDSDQIYLYVNDTEHLSVEDDNKVYYAAQHEDITIPCRPTHPDIKVELISYGAPIETSYNPRNGFTFTVSDLSFADTYTCIFTDPRDGRVFEYLFFLEINTSRSFLATPFIEDISFNHTEVGETLTLKCSLKESSDTIHFQWRTPRGNFNYTKEKKEEIVRVNQTIRDPEKKHYLKSTLEIKNTTRNDAGKYTCIVSDRQGHSSSSEEYVLIQDNDTCFIQIREENGQESVEAEAGQKVQWILELNAHPVPELTWYDNNKKVIQNDTTYHTEIALGKARFSINNVSLENNGSYILQAKSSRDHNTPTCLQEFELMLYVPVKPIVCLDTREECKTNENQSQRIYLKGEIVNMECKAKGNLLPNITWRHKECSNDDCPSKEVSGEKESTEGFVKSSYFNITTSHDGAVTCIGSNNLGFDKSTIKYYISDIKDGFDIINFSEEAIVIRNRTKTEVIVAINRNLTFTCAVSPRRSAIVEVFHNNTLIKKYHSNLPNGSLSSKVMISLTKAKLSDGGDYSCRIQNPYNHLYEYKNFTLAVKEPVKSKILGTNFGKEIVIKYLSEPYNLTCNYTAIPKASVEWYKDNDQMLPSDRILFEENHSILKFNTTKLDDAGEYGCKVINAYGKDERKVTLKLDVPSMPVHVEIYYITSIIGLLLLIAVIYIIIKRNKERALKRELKLLGLENFHSGNPENLNPELGIDDQAELLPYNKQWEFPVEQLKLGKQLGSGAFGVVVKAEAKEIIEGEAKTTVAVKMVKKNADQSYIKALASELKIMVHLGKHINVVNLLGACTKNVAKRELYVIVEYCRFGNLQNYLFKHRASFINQVDQVSGKIDYDIGTDILERTYSISSENTSYTVTPHSMQEYREKESNAPVNSASTQLTSMGEDSVILSNNSLQPDWRLNYRGDYKGNVKPVCTADLVVWSFQVARGMEYLASRKVLHGDLASRNILLADKNVVKICDFGLAKTMYNDNNYKKKENSPLPVKWMAIESIRDRVFSTQSDVWSFGVVLWELFSLARTPYPGMEADERLFYKLVEGYRMESPAYAPKEIYQIMLDCWHAKPLTRPSFTTLVERIGMLLEQSVQKHYIDLNDPYLKINTQKLEENDYLAMLSPPSFDILSTPSPVYVNGDVTCTQEVLIGYLPSGSSNDGYLFMGANSIFSPRVHNDGVFDFSTGKRRGTDINKENQELRPMLQSYNNESDSETGYLTPIIPNSISNPSYYMPPSVSSDNKNSIKNHDNYATMPQYENIVNNSFKNSVNQSSVILDMTQDKDKVNYVNSDSEIWSSVDV